MPRVRQLETLADLAVPGDGADMAISVRQEALLDDGRRIVLVDGRGWSAGLRGAGAGRIDVWQTTTTREITDQALVVVGPDEPFGDRTQLDMQRDHWAALAATLRAHGVEVDAGALGGLPHRVVLSERLRRRLGG